MGHFAKAMVIAFCAGMLTMVAVDHVNAGTVGGIVGLACYMLPNPIQQRKLREMREREDMREAMRRAGVQPPQ